MKNKELIDKSKELRIRLFDLVMQDMKGHIPSAYSCLEIVISLFYGNILKYDKDDIDKDRFIISKGHAAFVLYPILSDLNYFDNLELKKFSNPEGILRVYADHSIPGIEAISGSLGHGLGISAGLALSAKRDKKDYNSFVILGDGECYEGSVWESAMFAAHYELDNLITIVDRNGLCIMDKTENCIKLDSIEEKFKAFGWETVSVDGHSYESLLEGYKIINNKNGKPKAIIANTIKGKGISFMENKPLWHNKMPMDEQIKSVYEELEINKIVS